MCESRPTSENRSPSVGACCMEALVSGNPVSLLMASRAKVGSVLWRTVETLGVVMVRGVEGGGGLKGSSPLV